MRILIDVRHLSDPNPAGVGGYTIELLRALFRIDRQNEYVLLATGTKRSLDRLPSFDAPNARIVRIPIPNKLLSSSILTTRRPLLESLLPNFQLPITNHDLFFFPNHNFISTKLPYVITAHDLSFRLFPEFFSARMQMRHLLARPGRLFKNAAAVLTPSESTKQDLEFFYDIDPSKIHVTPLAASPNPPQSPTTHDQLPSRFILSLGTIEPRKNHLSLIEAYEQYRDLSKDSIALVVAGGRGWRSAPVMRAARRSRYHKDIHLVGYVSPEERSWLYGHAAVFVFPSFYEGFGLPVLEAMQHGVPVVTSGTSSLPELTDGTAVLIDPFNVNDLAVALRTVLGSSALRDRLSFAGQERAKLYGWEETARKTLEVFQNVGK